VREKDRSNAASQPKISARKSSNEGFQRTELQSEYIDSQDGACGGKQNLRTIEQSPLCHDPLDARLAIKVKMFCLLTNQGPKP
jgi:hypothetical protein